MKKRILCKFFTLATVFLLFAGCLGNDESYTVYSVYVPAVIENTTFANGLNAKYLSAYSGYVVPDDSSLLEKYNLGDCVYATIVLDSRNQVVDAEYAVGSEIQLTRIGQATVQHSAEPRDTTDYPFLTDAAAYFSQSFDPFYYNGRIFVRTAVTVSPKEEVEYQLSCNTNLPDSHGIYDLFMKAKVSGLKGDAESTEVYYAFNLKELFMTRGEESTVEIASNIRKRTLKIRLHYSAKGGFNEFVVSPANQDYQLIEYYYTVD